MIFGESGGGSKVSCLLASPQAQGLFHRAVIQSGPGIRMGDRAAATGAAELLLAELGLEPARLRDIQQLPTQRLLAAYFAVQTKLPAGGLGSSAFNPVLDPVLMPAHPFEPTASLLSADVPVIVGSNRTEATLFAMRDPEAFALDEAKLLERVRRRFPKDAERVIRAYREPDASPSDVYFRIETDQTFGNNSALLAERKAALGRAPAFLYRFDWPTPILDGRLGSPHGIEMPFVFDNIDEGGIGLTGGGEAANRLAARICATWIAFAETGRPDSAASGLPSWPAYDTKARSTMLFHDDSQVVQDPQGSVRKLLANLSRV
jgi:para-nitrobenzyl esterase